MVVLCGIMWNWRLYVVRGCVRVCLTCVCVLTCARRHAQNRTMMTTATSQLSARTGTNTIRYSAVGWSHKCRHARTHTHTHTHARIHTYVCTFLSRELVKKSIYIYGRLGTKNRWLFTRTESQCHHTSSHLPSCPVVPYNPAAVHPHARAPACTYLYICTCACTYIYIYIIILLDK